MKETAGYNNRNVKSDKTANKRNVGELLLSDHHKLMLIKIVTFLRNKFRTSRNNTIYVPSIKGIN